MDILKSVVITVLVLFLVACVIVFAGTFPHVFMSICFGAIFCLLVVVVHGVRNA